MEGLAAVISREEKRLGVGSKKFMQRHNEIMRMIAEAGRKGGKQDGRGSTDGDFERGIPEDRDKL